MTSAWSLVNSCHESSEPTTKTEGGWSCLHSSGEVKDVDEGSAGAGEKSLRMSMRKIHIPHLKGGKFVRFTLDLISVHRRCPAVFCPAKNFHHIIIWGIQRGTLAWHSVRFRIQRGALQCGAFAPHPPEAARSFQSLIFVLLSFETHSVFFQVHL